MKQDRLKRKVYQLWGMVALALVYLVGMQATRTLTGRPTLDNAIGVALGLYICSHPAANAVDMIFFDRGALRRYTSGWPGLGWLALNLLVLIVGWIVIFLSTTRLAGRII